MSSSNLMLHSKRDKHGTLLKFEAINKAKTFTDDIFKKIKILDSYKNITHQFNQDLFDIYIKKNLFEKILHITFQLEIIKFEIEINKSKKEYSINLCNLKFQYLERKIQDELSLIKGFNKKQVKIINNRINSNILKNLYYKLRDIVTINSLVENIFFKIFNFVEFLKILFFQLNFKLPNKNKKILVKYGEGIIQNKRSDLFWVNSNFQSKDIFVFFEPNISNLFKFKKIKKIKNKNYNICLFPQYKKTHLFKKLNFQINKKVFSDLDYWLYKKTKSFYGELENSISFFKKYNTKILFDPYEYGSTGVIYYQASEILNFCTIGKMRSYHSEISGKLYYSHLHDIHFTWGNHSFKRYLSKVNSENYYKSQLYILNGYSHFTSNTKKSHIKKIKSIKNKFNNLNIKKIILLLDNAINNAEWPKTGADQFITIEDAKKYFDYFFNILKKNKDIAIIIKSKDDKTLNNLYHKVNIYNELISSNRLLIVNNSRGIPASDYAQLADLVIGINTDDIPSAVMECLIHCRKAIFYDYSNLERFEKNLYNIGFNKFIFNSFDKLKNEFENYILDKHDNSFGNWDKLIDDIFSFKDYDGSKRMSDLVKELFKYLETHNKLESINKVSEYFSSKYGKDKIIKNI